jgi:subtilisin family serine protease
VISLGRGGPGHLQGDGSSFATPFVAGVAALVRAYYPALTAAQVATRLETTADHPGTALPDPRVGFGVVDPAAAVASVLPEEDGPVPPAAAPAPVSPPAAPVLRVAAGRRVALVVGGGAVLLALIAGLAAVVVPRGRERGWRPAD